MGLAENAYHFVTRWRLQGRCTEVADVFERADELPRWWPSVYLEVAVRKSGRPHALGDEATLLTKGWLPYTLRWQFTVVDERYPHGFTLAARGDFVGRGEWTFEQDGEYVNVTYDWNILIEKPLLRWFTPILRSIFSANHRWAMRMGERSLELELRRIHAASEVERRAIPAPPRPTFYRV